MVNQIGKIKINPPVPGVKGNKPQSPVNPAASFQKILQQQLGEPQLKFSAHALSRLQQREAALDGQILKRLENGVQQAAAKGSRQALVLVDELAFVVSVANKTVITAMTGESRKDNVFTNIDSTVIA